MTFVHESKHKCNRDYYHAVITEIADGRRVALSIWVHEFGSKVNACNIALHVQTERLTPPCDWMPKCEMPYSSFLDADTLWAKVPEAERSGQNPGPTLWRLLEEKLQEHLTDPRIFEQPGETWELRDARQRLTKARKAFHEANEELQRCEHGFETFCAKFIELCASKRP